jgi:ABC-type transport system involved in Fe-S cluster assembly fused permease/ATPase subunit
MHVTGIEKQTAKVQQTNRGSIRWDITLWVVLWPIFNTCSPTYAILVANILPVNFAWWVINILVYVIWLVLVLAAVAYGWRAIIKKLKRAADPNGRFKKIIAWLLIVIGVAILMKRDKAVETRLYDQWLVLDTTQWEVSQIQTVEETDE